MGSHESQLAARPPSFYNSRNEEESSKSWVSDSETSSVVGSSKRRLRAMTTRDAEVLKDGEMVNMDELFGNPKREWRNPLVLCGAIATAGVLVAGLASFRQGNFSRSQMLMRTRVGFQAATVALMVGTVYYQGMGTNEEGNIKNS